MPYCTAAAPPFSFTISSCAHLRPRLSVSDPEPGPNRSQPRLAPASMLKRYYLALGTAQLVDLRYKIIKLIAVIGTSGINTE